ncbi:MAG: hypothetical protein E6K99_00670 [Thaumarchaeota archaeon]|nr:MAG: hypothetical protein E6K99_00670 [Nitrososphaerota archaeon]
MVVATLVSFWSSLIEATYLTVRRSPSTPPPGRALGGGQALELIREKTRLVSTTTFIDTITNVVLASSIGPPSSRKGTRMAPVHSFRSCGIPRM